MTAGWIVGAVLAALTAAALIVRTRWLQSRTLEKCIGLSVVLHALVGIVCGLVGFAPVSRGRLADGRMTMVVELETEDPSADATGEETPADPAADAATGRAAVAAGVPAADPAPGEPEPIAARADRQPPDDLVPLLATEDAAAAPSSRGDPPESTASTPDTPARAEAASAVVPPLYADRGNGRRSAAAAARGGSEATERAVEAALGWLAASQSGDGRWEAARHGAGRARGSQHDGSVGARSDTGVTGLALLAFLGAGTTHRHGPHADRVARGIDFLLGSQRDDGSLAGNAEFFAALYCHGLATLALAECHALTGDQRLMPPLERAVRATLAAQHPHTGGWRYAPGDRGDTSQLGWQVMVLASARQAGIGGLGAAEAGARNFLVGVSSGRAGGLAAYRTGERPSVAMTAEALVCRLFLGLPVEHPAVHEALEMIGRHLPDRRQPNAYTWYYATLASFHCGGDQWDRWNRGLQAAALPLQRQDGGDLAGSWDPDPFWGGHGGRVYSTALMALSLEVYYRQAPIFRGETRLATVP